MAHFGTYTPGLAVHASSTWVARWVLKTGNPCSCDLGTPMNKETKRGEEEERKKRGGKGGGWGREGVGRKRRGKGEGDGSRERERELELKLELENFTRIVVWVQSKTCLTTSPC